MRFGPVGLRNHVIALLTRLKGARIESSDRNLFDALLYVAACHAVGIRGLDEKVLADLVSVDREWVQTLVVNPLGEEAAAVRSAGHVLTRHSSVASAILVAAEQDLGADTAEVWSAVVRQTIRTGIKVQMNHSWFSNIVHIGPQLQRKLPYQFAEQRRREIAIAAAKSAVEHQSTWLGCVVDLGKTYRNAGDLDAAVQVFRDNQVGSSKKIDFNEIIRSYWNTWGTFEGELKKTPVGALANAWLCALSISDCLTPAEIYDKGVDLACSSFGLAFGRLATTAPECPYAKARRAAAFLGWKTNPAPDSNTARHFKIHDREADKIRTRHPTGVEEAIDWLTTATAQAGRELQDPLLAKLLKPEQVSFDMLRGFLNPAPTHA